MSTTASADATTASPEPIMRTLLGLAAAQYLMVANDAGVFEQLGDDALTVEELATRTQVPVRSVRILADALVACGFLEKDGGRYRNGPVAATFLSGRTPVDLRPYVRMAHKIDYPAWGRFDEVIRAGGETAGDELFHVSGEAQRVMSEGIAALTSLGAAALAGAYDFGRFGRLLDVAGGAGIHLQTVLEANLQLDGTLFELPPVAARARQRLEPLIDAGRATVIEGDVFEDELPTGHDVVLVAHTLHLFTPEPNRELLERIRKSTDRGARLLLVDFWTDAEHTEPAPAALLAGEFYRLNGGQAYSVDEAQAWLAETGWRFLEHRSLAAPSTGEQAQPQGTGGERIHMPMTPNPEREQEPASADGPVEERRPDWFDASLFPFESRFLEVGRARVHYVDEGRGPVLLMLHGQRTWSFLFRHLIERLRDEFRCVALDYPGFGLSTAPSGYGFTISAGPHRRRVRGAAGARGHHPGDAELGRAGRDGFQRPPP